MLEGKNQKTEKIYNIGSVTNLHADSVVVDNALPSSLGAQLPDAAALQSVVLPSSTVLNTGKRLDLRLALRRSPAPVMNSCSHWIWVQRMCGKN